MLLLSREDVDRVFTMEDAVQAVKDAFRLLSEGKCEVPLRTNIQVPEFDASILTMPSYMADLHTMCIKVISLFPHNIDAGLPSSPAQILLFDGKTGIASVMLDGTYVTQLRTGAASGAAFDLLGREDARVGALIGTGGQAEKQLEAMLTVRPLEEVWVYDLDPARAKTFREAMKRKMERFGARIMAARSSAEAVEDADLITTVTPSRKPVFDARLVKPGVAVSCVGAYQPFMQEMDPRLLPMAAGIYFDSREAVLAESGDILKPLAEGVITEADFTGDLGDLILGKIPGRQSEEDILVFETVGVAAQDLVTARRIADKAEAAGIGTVW